MSEIWLSWSRLRSHESCKQMSYLQRQRKKNALTDTRIFAGGNLTDKIVRDWLLDDPWNNLGKMPDMIPEYMDQLSKGLKEDEVLVWRNSSDKKNLAKEVELAVTEIEPYLEKYVLPFEYTPDYAFKVPLSIEVDENTTIDLLLNGYMDILVKHSEGKYFIFDVKHTKNKDYWRSTIGQLAFYDTALYLLEGHYSSFAALLQPLVDPQVKTFDIKEVDRQRMWQSISNYAFDVAKNNTEPTSDVKQCGKCFLRTQCVRFQPKMVNGRRVVSL